MGDVVSLVSVALRHKLSTRGADALTEVEWHMLRVSQFLKALEERDFERFLTKLPVAEVSALADGLVSIGASEASIVLRDTARKIEATNEPGLGISRRASMRKLATQLEAAIEFLRIGIEQHLVEYAFRQRELAAERTSSESSSQERST